MDHQAVLQGDLQTVRQERNQDVCVGPMFQLMPDGPDAQLAFQRAEHTLDLRQLYVARPQYGGVFAGEVAAQQIVTLIPGSLTHREPELSPTSRRGYGAKSRCMVHREEMGTNSQDANSNTQRSG